MDIIDYDIVYADNPENLVQHLQSLISKGWQPYGPPVFPQVHGRVTRWYQPIVRWAVPKSKSSTVVPVEVIQALEFYADSKNWRSGSTGFAAQYDPEPTAVRLDGGHKASQALKALTG